MVLPQFFGKVPLSPHPDALFERLNSCHGRQWAGLEQEGIPMEAANGRTRARLIVVDFLATLFITFCIGVGTALALGACVVLMAGEAHGAAPLSPVEKPVEAPAEAQADGRARAADFVLAHYFTTKYVGIVAIDRVHATDATEPARCKTKPGKRCSPS
jgi:hypothetical protein